MKKRQIIGYFVVVGASTLVGGWACELPSIRWYCDELICCDRLVPCCGGGGGGGAVLLAWATDVGLGVSCASDVLVVGWETRLLLTDDVSFGSAWI